jgi:hypothetical protein
MARGDHLRVRRSTGYWHHGIDLGDGRVVHYAGEAGSLRNVAVHVSSWEAFQRGGPVEIVPYAQPEPTEAVVARALSRVGESAYNLLSNNCEHFARWCVTGRRPEPSAPSRVALPLLAVAVAATLATALALRSRTATSATRRRR